MTEPVDAQKAPETPASPVPVPASPVVVDAPPSATAPGAGIVGQSEQPLPGAQPGVVADTPVVAQSAADPHPEDSVKERPAPDAVKPQSADDPNPELTAGGATDPALHNPRPPLDAEPGVKADTGTAKAPRLEDAEIRDPDSAEAEFSTDEFDGVAGDDHPSKQPVALRPAPAGPPSHPHERVARAREENR